MARLTAYSSAQRGLDLAAAPVLKGTVATVTVESSVGNRICDLSAGRNQRAFSVTVSARAPNARTSWTRAERAARRRPS